MNKHTQLLELLTHEDNHLTEVIKVKTPAERIPMMGRGKTELGFYVNIYYCCERESIAGRQEALLKAIGPDEAALLLLKYKTLQQFKGAFKREMHWINQTDTRQTRFQKISAAIFRHAKKVGPEKLVSYVNENFDRLSGMLKVTMKEVNESKLDEMGILKGIESGSISAKRGQQLLDEYREAHSKKLCPFSGSGRNPEEPTRICSRTEDPYRLGDCGTCRVAAEWEEAYG